MSIEPIKQMKPFLCYNFEIITKILLRLQLSKNKKTLLIITDGIGHNESSKHNAFANAIKPTYDYLFKNVPFNFIKTSGLNVGLPEGQMGNSEVGHMTIGAGRVLHQDLVKINMSIKDKSINSNFTLNKIIQKSNTIHLIGLLSDGGVHSHIDHIITLALLISQKKSYVKLHVITDGRDVPPKSAIEYVNKIKHICNKFISIATVSGRYFAMDRDNNWDRIEKAHNEIVNGQNLKEQNVNDYIQNLYDKNITDEFITPASFNNYHGLNNNDGLIFCNYRSDRSRQISRSIVDKKFSNFFVQNKKLNAATMTQYDENFSLDTLFNKDMPKNTLSSVLEKENLTQYHIAETEKYAHVTFFFNGGTEKKLKNEYRVLIPSLNIKTYDLEPQMSANQITKEVINAMNKNTDFIVVNFANGDMVGHTGNYDASLKAVECVDTQIGLLIKKAKKNNYNLVLTSDHGNCEMMKDENENILTNHTTGDVYCFIMAQGITKVKQGALDNIAPTILKLMDIKIPDEMNHPII